MKSQFHIFCEPLWVHDNVVVTICTEPKWGAEMNLLRRNLPCKIEGKTERTRNRGRKSFLGGKDCHQRGESNPTMAPSCETTTWQGYKCARTVPCKSRKSKFAKVHGLPSCFARKQKSWTLLCTSVIHLYSKELVVIDRQCVFGKHFKEEVVMYC